MQNMRKGIGERTGVIKLRVLIQPKHISSFFSLTLERSAQARASRGIYLDRCPSFSLTESGSTNLSLWAFWIYPGMLPVRTQCFSVGVVKIWRLNFERTAKRLLSEYGLSIFETWGNPLSLTVTNSRNFFEIVKKILEFSQIRTGYKETGTPESFLIKIFPDWRISLGALKLDK